MSHPSRKKTPNRSEPPKTYSDYKKYKSYLADDFHLSCGYCGVHHMYFGYQKGFHIDHFAPKSRFPELICEYTNLVYTCPVCNIAKHDDWCTDKACTPISNGQGYIDPCCPEYDEVFYRNEYGKICVKTSVNNASVGQYMYNRMKFFLKRHEIFWVIEYFDDTLDKLNTIFSKMHNDSFPYFWEVKNMITKLEKMRQKYRKEQKLLNE